MPNTRDEDDGFTGSQESAAEVFGPYLVYERLGIGGMATVHRAKKRGIAGFERGLALKRILPHLSDDAEFVSSFVREAKLASLLVHPNIAQIYDFGQIGDVYFIAMEHVDGFDISKLLRYSHRFNTQPPLPVVLAILCELCEALDYAHRFVDERGQRLGIVHRDVSPSNLLVATTGHLKVIDFGIAKASPRPLHTDSGRVKGKLGYMSPEAVVGAPVSPASDVFSAGVVAHELLTVHPLFSARTDHETVRRVREAEIVPPSWRNPRVPPALDRLVLAALERDDRRRLQSAHAFRKGLEEVVLETGLRCSASDVAAWWASGTRSNDHERPRGSSPTTSRVATMGGFPLDGSPGSRSRMSSPRSAEHSVAHHEAQAADRVSGSMEQGSGEPAFTVSAPRIRSAPPRARSRMAMIVVLAGALTIAAALGSYLFLVRPAGSVVPAISAPQPSAAAPGSVRFIVRPPDAIVEIGDKEVAHRSPFELPLERGLYSVVVRHAGYKRWTSQITLQDGESQAVNVALEPASATIRLSSEPAGLLGELDGKPLDHVTPAEFETAAGPHRLIVTGAAGTWTRDFVAATDGIYAFHAVLPLAKRAPSTGTTPGGARTTSASERPPPRATSGNAARMQAVREAAVVPEERVELAPDPFAGPSPAKVDPPTRTAAQPAPTPTSLATATRSVSPSSAPPLVPATTVTKLSGEIPAIPSGSGTSAVYSKLCIGLDGHVTSVKIVKAGTGVAAELERSLLSWRYRPYVNDAGQPSPVCFAVTFRLVFERAHRVATIRHRSVRLRRLRLHAPNGTAHRPTSHAEFAVSDQHSTMTHR